MAPETAASVAEHLVECLCGHLHRGGLCPKCPIVFEAPAHVLLARNVVRVARGLTEKQRELLKRATNDPGVLMSGSGEHRSARKLAEQHVVYILTARARAIVGWSQDAVYPTPLGRLVQDHLAGRPWNPTRDMLPRDAAVIAIDERRRIVSPTASPVGLDQKAPSELDDEARDAAGIEEWGNETITPDEFEADWNRAFDAGWRRAKAHDTKNTALESMLTDALEAVRSRDVKISTLVASVAELEQVIASQLDEETFRLLATVGLSPLEVIELNEKLTVLEAERDDLQDKLLLAKEDTKRLEAAYEKSLLVSAARKAERDLPCESPCLTHEPGALAYCSGCLLRQALSKAGDNG